MRDPGAWPEPTRTDRRGWRRAGARAILAAVCGLASALPASGQQRDTAAADTAEAPLYRLRGIEVTVTRSRERVDRSPFAIGVLGASAIQSAEPTISLDESLLEIPGVFVNNRQNFALGNRISIRGFGSRSQFGVRGIRVIQDGIPLTLPDGQAQLNNVDLAAAGRIEVIRGPASALYGNAAGGVISIQTQPPPATLVRPEVRVTGGGYGNDRFFQKYDLQFGGRSGDFDYVTHLGHFQTDGFRLHSQAENTLFNTRIGYAIDARSELRAVANYVNAPVAQNPSALPDSLARANPDTARDLVLGPAECPPGASCQDLGESSKQGQFGLTYRRLLGAAHRLELTGYGSFRELDNPIPFTLIRLDRIAGGGRIQYEYAPPGGRLAGLTVGLDVEHQNDDRRERFRDDEGVGGLQLDQQETVTGTGLFVNSRWRLTADIELTAGGRYDAVRFSADDRLVTDSDPDDSGARTLDQFSPVVGLRYTHAGWLNVYGNVGRSFQTPTTTELTDTLGGFNAALEPQRALSVEIGAKGTVADLFSYTLALYRMELEDQLIAFQPEGIQRDFFENAGSSRNRGLELGLSALLLPRLTLDVAYTLTDFDFETFVTDDGDFSGNEVPGIPPHQLHGRLAWAHASGLSARVEVTAVDGFFVDNENAVRNDPYAVTDLRFAYDARVGGLAITPFLGIDNVTDERYNPSVVVNAFGGRFFEPAPGRHLYGGLRASFR